MNKDAQFLAEAYEDIHKKATAEYDLLDTLKTKYSGEQYPYEALLGAIRGYIGLKGTEGTVKELLETLTK